MATKAPTHAEILRLFGTIDDLKVVEITDLNPSMDELEVAEAYLAGLTDVMGKQRLPLTGKAAEIFDIVTRDDDLAEEDYRRE